MIPEIYYIAFVLGYDLLQTRLSGELNLECDTCFSICMGIADEFMKSVLYATYRGSTYEALQVWLGCNNELVERMIADGR